MLDRLGRILATRAFLAAVLAVAALLRLGHIAALRPLPLFDGLILDSEAYDAWAQRIAVGDWLGGQRAYYMDPLYPYVLALVFTLFGHDLLVVRLLQAALGVATCALVAAIGRSVGGLAIGNLAALFLALYGPAVFQEAEIEKTALGVFLATAALALALARPAAWAWLLCGSALGLAALTRANALLLAPLLAAYLFFANGRRWRPAAAFLLGLGLALAPVAARNRYVAGEWILTTSQAGPNFFTGNNPGNEIGTYMFMPFVRPHPAHEESDFRAAAEARAGRPLTSREVSSYWFGEALKHIAAHPAMAARVTLRKVALFWGDFEVPDGWDMNFLARYSWVLRLPLLGMASLLPLALLGAVTGFARERGVRLLVAYAALYSASVIAFFIFSRYRMHVVQCSPCWRRSPCAGSLARPGPATHAGCSVLWS
jgi:4-amino-4-deoxy-L-arabinose transferase-like glycosyltransferase